MLENVNKGKLVIGVICATGGLIVELIGTKLLKTEINVIDILNK